MKALLILIPLSFSLASFAQKDSNNFEARKKSWIQHLDKKIESNQNAKKCAQAAKDKEALRECRQKFTKRKRRFKKKKSI